MSPHMCWVCEGSKGLKLRSPVSRPVSRSLTCSPGASSCFRVAHHVPVVRQVRELAAVDGDHVPGDVRRRRRTRGTAPRSRGPRARRPARSSCAWRSPPTISGGHAALERGRAHRARATRCWHRTLRCPYCVATMRISCTTPGLGARVHALGEVTGEALVRRGADDRAAAAVDHVRDRVLAAEHRTAQVDPHRVVPPLDAHLVDGLVEHHRVEAGVGRVVEQDVQPAERRRRPGRSSP